jgi:hypothetical protein
VFLELGKELSIPYCKLLQRVATAKFSLGIKIGGEITTANVRNLSVTASRGMEKTWRSRKVTKEAMNTTFMISEVIKENAVVKFKFQQWQNPWIFDLSRLSVRSLPVAITLMLGPLFLEVGRWFINKILNLSGLRIYPPNDPTSLYKNNPLYCGLEALRLEIPMESLGISQANVHCSFVLVAHLYNAAQQKRLIQGAWPALEHAIEANMSLIFSGDLPKHIGRFCRDFSYT